MNEYESLEETWNTTFNDLRRFIGLPLGLLWLFSLYLVFFIPLFFPLLFFVFFTTTTTYHRIFWISDRTTSLSVGYPLLHAYLQSHYEDKTRWFLFKQKYLPWFVFTPPYLCRARWLESWRKKNA